MVLLSHREASGLSLSEKSTTWATPSGPGLPPVPPADLCAVYSHWARRSARRGGGAAASASVACAPTRWRGRRDTPPCERRLSAMPQQRSTPPGAARAASARARHRPRGAWCCSKRSERARLALGGRLGGSSPCWTQSRIGRRRTHRRVWSRPGARCRRTTGNTWRSIGMRGRRIGNSNGLFTPPRRPPPPPHALRL